MEAEEERAAEAQREKEAGNDAYRKQYLETAVDHYTRGAALDPRDISFLTNRAAAYLLMSKVGQPPPLPRPKPSLSPRRLSRSPSLLHRALAPVSVQGVRERLRGGGGEGQGAPRRQQAARAGAVAEGVRAAQARGLRCGLRAGDQGAAAVARRALQRGHARQAGPGGERQEGDRGAGAARSGSRRPPPPERFGCFS